MADTFRDAGDGKKATATLLANGATVSGTLTEMAADAILLTTANEGKRWQATDDSDRIYSYRLVGTTWDYYLESGTDSDGNIRTRVSGIGMYGIAHNRNIAAAAHTTYVAATNSDTFTAGEDIREVTLRSKISAVSNSIHKTRVVINAPTDAIAKAWLEDNGSIGQDVVYETYDSFEAHTMQRTSAILRIDVLPVGGVNAEVSIAGVGVES